MRVSCGPCPSGCLTETLRPFLSMGPGSLRTVLGALRGGGGRMRWSEVGLSAAAPGPAWWTWRVSACGTCGGQG